VVRDTITDTADDLRRMYGPEYFAKESLKRIAEDNVSNAVIESIRALGEAAYLKTHGAVLWAVDADVRTRYERIVKRQSETDRVSFEKFVADEQREFANADPTKGNLKGVIQMADLVLLNNGTQEELFAQVDVALQKSGVQ
jgi:dephospho-CoA kinase